MPIKYNKLFHLLIEMDWKKGELQKEANITASIMARLAKNEIVRTDTIAKICGALRCQPGDIMEYIEIDDLLDKNKRNTHLKIIKKPQLYREDIEAIMTMNEIEKEDEGF